MVRRSVNNLNARMAHGRNLRQHRGRNGGYNWIKSRSKPGRRQRIERHETERHDPPLTHTSRQATIQPCVPVRREAQFRGKPMITMLGSPRRCCAGLTRRETLTAGALSLLGGAFNLPSLFAAEAQRPADARPGKAKSVILLNLLGGAATQDMFDLKPAAPAGVRSEFKPIDTNVLGVRICEHLPRMAKGMHRVAIVRSVNHKAGCHNCLPLYTGHEALQPDQHPHDSDPPSMGSVCEYLNTQHGDFPAYVFMPCWLGWGQAFRRGGPYAGFLGKRYDALTTQ